MLKKLFNNLKIIFFYKKSRCGIKDSIHLLIFMFSKKKCKERYCMEQPKKKKNKKNWFQSETCDKISPIESFYVRSCHRNLPKYDW